MEKIDKKEQEQTPYIEAFKKYLKEKNIPFDLPGHGDSWLDSRRRLPKL